LLNSDVGNDNVNNIGVEPVLADDASAANSGFVTLCSWPCHRCYTTPYHLEEESQSHCTAGCFCKEQEVQLPSPCSEIYKLLSCLSIWRLLWNPRAMLGTYGFAF
jgi:hypothetical protein